MNILRKALKLQFFLLFYTSLFTVSAYSVDTEISNTNTENVLRNLTEKNPVDKFNLPINNDISLNITIPQGLEVRYERPDNPHFIQYGDKDILFSISNDRGGKLQAKESLEKGLKVMQDASQVTILEQADHNYPGYMDGYRIVKVYDTKKNTTDIMYFYAGSGPNDSAGILYAVRMKKDDNVDTVVQNVKKAFNASVKIIDKSSKSKPIIKKQ